MEIKDIVDFMSEGIERTAEERQKMEEYFTKEAASEQYVNEENPVDVLYQAVKDAPFVFARDMDIAGPFRSFNDYKFNGRIMECGVGVNEINNASYTYRLNYLSLRSSSTGLLRATYTVPDAKTGEPFTLREDIYYKGTLLAENIERDISGNEVNKIIVHTNNPLAGLYQEHLEKQHKLFEETMSESLAYAFATEVGMAHDLSVVFTDEVVNQPSNEELISDFRSTYSMNNNLASESPLYDYRQELFEIPCYDDDNNEHIIKITGDDVFGIVTKYITENYQDDERLAVINYLDYSSFVHETMEILGNEEILEYLEQIFDVDTENITKDSLKEIKESAFAYIKQEVVPDIVDYAVVRIVPELKTQLEAGYSQERAEKAEKLKQGVDPFSEEFLSGLDKTKAGQPYDGVNIFERYEAINRGLYSITENDMYIFIEDEKGVDFMDNRAKEVVKAFDELESRAFVTNLSKHNASRDEAVTLCLMGPKYFDRHPGESFMDVVSDYEKFREKTLPALNACANKERNPLDANTRMAVIKDYTDVFMQGKLMFKSSLFKEPCDRFCKIVADEMKHDDKLNAFIKNNGKGKPAGFDKSTGR